MKTTETKQQKTQEQTHQAAALLRSMGNEHRLLILCMLIKSEEMHVGQLLSNTSLSQSALSQHLAKLREAGLVSTRRESQTIFYSIENDAARRIVATLSEIYCPEGSFI